ncbi:TPM domain-containing protein [Lysobacter arvi]|uniref:TPM domain-containing protein n=1 Tax=Lysobacter arvi TaxID=3038776 RepID=A0ABU1CDX2_9GAMM|nr:TPM domain-containing protein [Lysobacter arvi]MDR0183379.1 TPM domain-containing protein [Lysobacter arvi]
MRLFKHLFAPSAKRLFPGDSLKRITDAIAESERHHTGEICFAVEPALHPRAVMAGEQARDRAHEAFAELRVWDTQANNGVLLYLLLADHRIEIVADRGFAGRVSDEQWRGVCQLIEERLRAGEAEAGVLAGVSALTAILVEHFPREEGTHDTNELPDLPYVL